MDEFNEFCKEKKSADIDSWSLDELVGAIKEFKDLYAPVR